MSHHHSPICKISGKVRYRERKDFKFALRRADRDRSQARLNEVECGRREISGYECSDCGGWHLTSQPAASVRLAPVAKPPVRIPGPAAEAIRRMVAATGLTVGNAA
jgi:hypothetical protein